MRANPGLDPILFRVRLRADNDGAAGMVFGDLENDIGVPWKRAGLFTVNGEVHERRPRHRAAALGPKLFQLPIDLPDLDRKTRSKRFSWRRHSHLAANAAVIPSRADGE